MSKEFLSQLVHYRTYANYLPDAQRRETIDETIARNCKMHTDKYPQLKDEIEELYKEVYAKRAVPSMRSFQFGGAPIERRNLRMFNCSFLNIESIHDISDLFYASMSGTGVGYSVKQMHVSKLPIVPVGSDDLMIIEDSAEGWCHSVTALLTNPMCRFEYSLIRPAGAKLSSGGTASGPEALVKMHIKVREILKSAVGRKLSSFEVHRICCLIADCVVVGGVRRGALISLFDDTDDVMMNCKSGQWWETYPELARSNNSAHVLKSDPDVDDKIRNIVQACFDGGQAEPGLSLSNDLSMGYNPCHEISLISKGLCNLTEVNAAECNTPEEFYKAVEAATAIGTLQASYTDFGDILSPEWKKNAEDEALLGVSITGQAEAQTLLTADVLRKGALLAVGVNKSWAEKIGIKPAKRITTTKPSGSASSWLGTTPGVHAGHEKRYLRRVRLDGNTAIGLHLQKYLSDFVEKDPFNAANIIVQIPIELKDSVLLRSQENAVACLERVKFLYNNWIKPGHVEGNNTHNISLTINYLESEKEAIKKWMVKNKDHYYGISLIPYDGGDYPYLPYSQPVHKEVFAMLEKIFESQVKNFKFDDIREVQDNTDKKSEPACAGGACVID